ncbi:MAG: SLC13 family permease [Alphaproteobacteria bacterium]
MEPIYLDPIWHIAFVLGLTGATMVSFALDKLPVEHTALAALGALLVFYQFFPLEGPDGGNLLTKEVLLAGFANPSLLAVLALLVIGQGMVQTDALTPLTNVLLRMSKFNAFLAIALSLIGVLVVSGALNNTPLVIMFIPIMQQMASQLNWSTSRLMMPLSYAAILGGMTTLIGSSTNLLVSSTLVDMGHDPIGFFDFTLMGGLIASAGLLYVLFVLPRLMPNRQSFTRELFGEGKQFIAEIEITKGSPLEGKAPVAGRLPGLEDTTIRLIQRGGMIFLPPFDSYSGEAGDILIIAATRQSLTELIAKEKGFFLSSTEQPHPTGDPQKVDETGQPVEPDDLDKKSAPAQDGDDEHLLTEVMVAPASRLIDQPLDQSNLKSRFGGVVLGIQRRARMVRGRMGEIRLQAGDVLLLMGTGQQLDKLRGTPDIIQLAWSTRNVPLREKAPHATAIFLGVVALAGAGVIPIAVSAIIGAVMMIFMGCLNIRQATRSLDRKIVLLVASALAISAAMDKTGAAQYVALGLLDALPTGAPMMVLAVLFLLVAVTTNVLSNNATAVLFTPIAVSVGSEIGVDPFTMAVTVLLAANCSFASPIGYQTNLLVMGPGHYQFRDYIKGGVPLILILWIAYLIVFPAFNESLDFWFFGLEQMFGK